MYWIFPIFFQLQMERVQQYELWEKNKRREMQYIKTTTSVEGQPQIFYLPKVNQGFLKAKDNFEKSS